MNAQLVDKVRSAYVNQFGSAPACIVRTPGRINLIGEHTDYNLGHVLPAAVRQSIYLAMGPGTIEHHEWIALDRDQYEAVPLQSDNRHGDWPDFLVGSSRYFARHASLEEQPFCCVFGSDLPEGAGLSSSSALTCGVLIGLQALHQTTFSPFELAMLAHEVERAHIGLQGGIMDQVACLMSRPDHVLHIDCLSREVQAVRCDLSQVNLFLINTNVSHKLTDSDYNVRAAECQEIVKSLRLYADVESLRDVDLSMLQKYRGDLDDTLYQRAEFVVQENARVMQTVKALQQGDWNRIGPLINASHAGLRDQYAVSCAELDFVQEWVIQQPGVLGARMMGGGFGGCVLGVMREMPDFQALRSAYRETFGIEAMVIEVDLGGGGEVIGSLI